MLAGMPPVRLLALEGSKVWHGQEEQRRLQGDLSHSRWQEEWDTSGCGRLTHARIPTFKEWMLREHGAMEYRLTQALSGHGCFGNYLAKREHRPTSSCRLCGEEEGDAEHTLFTCPAHDDDRRRATAEIGAALSKDNLIPTMLASQEKWDQIATFIRRVTETKEEKERGERRRD